MLWTQFVTTFALEIIGLYEKQFGTGGGMSRTHAYDLVIIGGGIVGSSLACSMAKAGARVLLLESEIEFRDRVRGEILCPWGVAEIHSLGLSEALRNGGACEVGWLDQYMGRNRLNIATSLQRLSPALLSTPSTIRACKLRSCKRLNPLAPRFGAARASVLSARALRRA